MLVLYASFAFQRFGQHFLLGGRCELCQSLRDEIVACVTGFYVYHVIGVTGFNAHGKKIGVCSGGAGEFAEEARRLGCDLYVTGEANWGERVAAANVGQPMVCAGHYATETFGVKALMRELKKSLKLSAVFVDGEMRI